MALICQWSALKIPACALWWLVLCWTVRVDVYRVRSTMNVRLLSSWWWSCNSNWSVINVYGRNLVNKRTGLFYQLTALVLRSLYSHYRRRQRRSWVSECEVEWAPFSVAPAKEGALRVPSYREISWNLRLKSVFWCIVCGWRQHFLC